MIANFYMPTKVIMGENCIVNHAEQFKSLGSKALLVTGAKSAKLNGAQADVITTLESLQISYIIYDKVMSNPTIACVYEGAKLAREEDVDFIIAIGGGSPMDAGKAIALLASQDIKEEDIFSGDYGKDILPMVFVPTTSGTGSEVTQYSILTNDKKETKTSISSPILFPTISFLDAKYTYGLSRNTTINTAIDALSHSVEGMLTKKASKVTDILAIESIKTIVLCLKELMNGDITKESRSQLMYGSMLGGMVIAHTGTTAVHSMGYGLTYFKNVDHGRANGLLLSEYLSFVKKENPAKIEEILEAMGMERIDELKSLLEGLLGEKETITEQDIEKYASISIQAKNIANCLVAPNYDDIVAIYKKSFNLL